MKKSKIAGIAFNVPDNIVTNHDIEKMMDTTDEWIQTRSGIKERRWVLPGTPNSDLALPACVKAIENAGISPNDIDAIIDDTDENFSSKVKKMNLIGAPFQIIIGKKSDGDLLEFKEIGKETQNLPLKKIVEIITKQKSLI